jgi:predicted amidophosphoribosyltransferase
MSFFANLLRNMSSKDYGRQRHGSSSRSGHHGSRDGEYRQDGYEARGAACANCRAPLVTGAKFCAECGITTASRTCTSCSKPLASGARFCASCGTAVA